MREEINRHILLIGANGFVGRNFYEHNRRRTRITPVVRTRQAAATIGTEECVLLDDVVQFGLTGEVVDAVIHLAGSTREQGGGSLWRDVVDSTRTAVQIAHDLDAQRIIYLSGYGVWAGATDVYYRAKAEAEQVIEESSIPYTIFQCSYILGAGDELTPGLASAVKQGIVEIPGDGTYRIQPLSVTDVSEIMLRAAEDTPGSRCKESLLGEVARYVDIVKAIRRTIDCEAEIRGVPIERYIRCALFEEDPDFSSTELGILISDYVGPPSLKSRGVTLSGVGEILSKALS